MTPFVRSQRMLARIKHERLDWMISPMPISLVMEHWVVTTCSSTMNFQMSDLIEGWRWATCGDHEAELTVVAKRSNAGEGKILQKSTEGIWHSRIDERQTHQLIEDTKRCEVGCRFRKRPKEANGGHLSRMEMFTNQFKQSLGRIHQMYSDACLTKEWKNTYRECLDGVIQRQILADLDQNLRTQCNRPSETRRLKWRSCCRSPICATHRNSLILTPLFSEGAQCSQSTSQWRSFVSSRQNVTTEKDSTLKICWRRFQVVRQRSPHHSNQ